MITFQGTCKWLRCIKSISGAFLNLTKHTGDLQTNGRASGIYKSVIINYFNCRDTAVVRSLDPVIMGMNVVIILGFQLFL